MIIMLIEHYFPVQAYTNQEIEKDFPDWDSSKIESKVGIVSRHVVTSDETALDLAEKACIRLFESHPEIRSRIDYLLFCTQSPDHILPGNASILQHRLGLSTSIGALDYNLGCSGYIYGLSLAKGLLSAGISKNLLLVTAETYTKHIHPRDKGNRSIFGDAATVTCITSDDLSRIGEFVFGTDGSGAQNLIIKNGGARYPVQNDPECKVYGSGNCYTDNDLFMDGPEIFNFTIERVPTLADEILKSNHLEKDQIKFFVFHQANAYILNFLRKMCGIPKEKFYLNMTDTGNTVSNTIPIALSDLIGTRQIGSGDKVLIAGFGVGYSYGATVLTF